MNRKIKIFDVYLWDRNASKTLKRLHSTFPSFKSSQCDENHHRFYNNDLSLLSSNSNSSPLHSTVADSTTSTHINNGIDDHEQNSDRINLNFPSVYHSQLLYNPYANDSSSMIYNPTYPYMGSTSGSSMNFSSYGCYTTPVYSTNNYNAPFF